MSLSTSEIRHIARLARLRFEPDEERELAQQLSKILEYVDRIGSFEATSANGDARSHGATPEADDAPLDRSAARTALENAPASMDRFVVVPRILREER